MSTKHPYDEAALLALLRQDSEYAFQLVFDLYRNRVYRIAMLYVKSPALAEDIVQDVFLKIWFQRKNLTELVSFESWIYTLTKNLTINCLKKLAYEGKARAHWNKENSQVYNTTDHKIRNTQYTELLMQAITKLPEQQQKVYRLGKETGLSYEAIARELSISPLTVKTHMARALAAIRSFLQQHDKELMLLFIMRLMAEV
jgi:RNA polymerase sigma-70 factor (family 1)